MKYWFYYFITALVFSASLNANTLQRISHAQFNAEGAATQAVTLPHYWPIDTSSGHYRVSFGPLPDDTVYAVLLPKLVMTASIRLNRVELFSSPLNTGLLPRHGNTPIRLYLPRSALLTNNTLEITLLGYPGAGALAPLFIGPKDDIEEIYQDRLFWQQTVHQYGFIISLCAAAFSLMLWLFQRQRMAFLYFSAAAFFSSFYSLNLFTINAPVSNGLWLWWLHSCIEFAVVSAALFFYRIINVSYPRFEQALISFAIGASAVYFASDLNTSVTLSNGIHIISAGLIVYVTLTQLRNCQKTGAIEARLFVFSSLVITLLSAINGSQPLALYDDPFVSLRNINITAMAIPLFTCAMLWVIITRYAELATNIDDLQKNLTAKIHTTTQTYRQEQLKAHTLNLTEAAALERQQVYNSLYEDLADKLSAIYHTAADTQQADAAQAAIAELRDTAQTHQHQAHQLSTELANIRAEISARCEQVGLVLNWELLINLPLMDISSSFTLALKRILREALSNTIKHADASIVFVAINMTHENSVLIVRFGDNGCGISAAVTAGRGMANMRKRAHDLGGSIDIAARPDGGTQLLMSLPCAD